VELPGEETVAVPLAGPTVKLPTPPVLAVKLFTRFATFIEPRPVVRSYPVPAL
jgi:hypothetical protein